MPKKEVSPKETKITKSEILLRPPVVTIMGHVDHGKTSLLDAIRKTNVTATESGGITQHTSAYKVVKDGKEIVFIDTPGHAAFTNMRKRGGSICDIIILVVALDDGVMPQTKEAISIAKEANVPIIVALNKADLEGVNKDKVKKQLADEGILVEGMGGDIVTVETSATKGIGIDSLLEVINLTAEIISDRLKIEDVNRLDAAVIDAKHTRKQGNLVTVVIKSGGVKLRDEIVALGSIIHTCKIKSLTSTDGQIISEAKMGSAVNILGFETLPMAGDIIREKGAKLEDIKSTLKETVSLLNLNKTGKNLNIVLKADAQGTLEAVIESLYKLEVDGAKVNIVSAETGEVNESDVLLAQSVSGIIVGFKVKASSSVEKLAEDKKILVALYEVIYKLIEEIQGALEGVVEIEESKIKGKGLVIKLFKLPKSDMLVCGTLVEAGKYKINNRVAIYRGDGDKPLFVTRIKSIHIGPKEVEQAVKGDECGLLFKPQINNIELDDIIEVL